MGLNPDFTAPIFPFVSLWSAARPPAQTGGCVMGVTADWLTGQPPLDYLLVASAGGLERETVPTALTELLHRLLDWSLLSVQVEKNLQ